MKNQRTRVSEGFRKICPGLYLHYCNGAFTGRSKMLKLIQSAAARVLTKTSKVDHITPVLRYLHWLYSVCHSIAALLQTVQSSQIWNGLLTVPRVKTEHREAAFSF